MTSLTDSVNESYELKLNDYIPGIPPCDLYPHKDAEFRCFLSFHSISPPFLSFGR